MRGRNDDRCDGPARRSSARRVRRATPPARGADALVPPRRVLH